MKTNVRLGAYFAALAFAVSVANAQTTTNLPTVSLSGNGNIAEADGGLLVTVTREGTNSFASDLTVYYSATGEATAGADYVALPGFATIPAGKSSTSFVVSAIDDSLAEPTENLFLTLQTNAAYRVGSSNRAVISILDNDNVRPAVQIINPTNNATATTPTNIVVQALATDSDGSIKQVYFYKGGALIGISSTNVDNVFSVIWTNIQPGNYTLTAFAIDNLNAGTTSEPINVTVGGETNHPPLVSLVAPTNGTVFNLPTNIVFAASASDTDGTIRSVSFYRSGAADPLATRSIPTNGLYTFSWAPGSTVSNGNYFLTARALDDFGQTSTSAPVSVILQRTNQTSLPTISVVATDAVAAESSSGTTTNSGVFRISRSGGNTNATLTVEFAFSGTATYGIDYDQTVIAVVFDPGSLSREVVIKPIDDTLIEGTEAAVLTLKTNAYYIIGSPGAATISIEDNDHEVTNLPPVVQITMPTNGAIFTAPTNLIFFAQASDPGGTGTNGHWVDTVEFIQNGTNSLGIATNCLPCANIDNPFHITWTNVPPGNYTVHALATDNEGATAISARIQFTVNPASTNKPSVKILAVDEIASEPGQDTASAQVARIGSTNEPLTVYYSVKGTASNGVDYVLLPGSLTIPSGATNAFLIVTPVDDTKYEGNETVAINLLANTAYNLTTPTNVTLTIRDNESNQPPAVTLVSPTNGSAFTLPTNILLKASATDSDVSISNVQFYQNGILIGGQPVLTNDTYNLSWTPLSNGTYSLTAKAFDNFQASATSTPITVTVTGATNSPLPTLSVVATDADAAEMNSAGGNPGYFKVTRTGGTNASLTFYFELGGTAVNGVDYSQLTLSGTLPAGVTSGFMGIYPTDDTLVEGTETVVITLRTNSAYLVSADARTATVSIADNDTITNISPTVHLTWPSANPVYTAPARIEIAASASDGDGQVTNVDFYAGDHLIGSDKTAPYNTVWTNVEAGIYNIRARATDNGGAICWSEPVKVTVKSPLETSFVKRTLPMWYVAGVPLLIHLHAEPKTNSLYYSVEDLAPTNWTKGAISDGGYLDPDDKKIKFGPFSDTQPRTLTYEVTPPADEKNERHFVGSGIADGLISPILGNGVINPAPAHPADREPSNRSISLAKLTAYNTAWKKCDRWPISPNPIPVSYVSRVAYLYLNGGDYTISTNSPTPFPPLLWVPTNGAPVIDLPWETNRLAVSSMPTNYTIGTAITVSIVVTPDPATSAYAIEDRVPEGWAVSNVTSDGAFCPMTSKVRWGVFLDHQPRTLTYTVTPKQPNVPGSAYFAGTASFDGVNTAITGQRRTSRATTLPPADLQSVRPLTDGNRLLTFIGNAGTAYTLECSTNFIDWEPLEMMLNNDGVLQYIDLATNNVLRFYRALPNE